MLINLILRMFFFFYILLLEGGVSPRPSQQYQDDDEGLADDTNNDEDRIQTWALEEARRRLEIEGILEDPFPVAATEAAAGAVAEAEVKRGS